MDDNNKEMTTIYGNDNDEDEQNIKQVFENIEEESCGYKGLSEPEKAELKELRQAVSDICYSIFEIISSGNLKISNEHMIELKDYIDDSLLWLHIHEKPNRTDYKIKIDEINETCNKIFDHYKQTNTDVFKKNELVVAIKNSRDELENECLVIQLLIQDNAFPLSKKFLAPFSEYIKSTLEWISEKDSVNNDNDKTEYYNECKIKLDDLRNECSDIHQKMQGVNLDKNRDIFGDNRVILTGYVENENNDNDNDGGTDIISLMRRKQQDLLTEMMENEDECENIETI
jgi:hypothetical protein